LQYLYADQLDFENLSARQALDLSVAAHSFDLPRLIRLCRDRVRATISLDNVHSLLKVAHDTKEERVRAYCVNFASRHRKDFIGNKPEIGKIGVDLFQDVMASLMMEDENEISEPDPIPPKTLVNDFKKLHTDVDIGALSGDSVISFKGADMQFHKAFFAIHSKSLSQSFQPVSNGDENTTEMLKVKTLLTSNDAFRAILRYLYYGDLSGLNVMIACEVQDFAKTHGMLELQQICEFVMAVNINVDSVMSVMRVVFHPGNIKRPELENIRKNTLYFFRENITKIKIDLATLMMNGPIVMVEIILSWQMAEQAKAEGVSADDLYKKRGIAERRYSNFALGVSDEQQGAAASYASGSSSSSSSSAVPPRVEEKKEKEEKRSEEKEMKKQASTVIEKEEDKKRVGNGKEEKKGKGKESKDEKKKREEDEKKKKDDAKKAEKADKKKK